jgi:cell division protein FtsI (penicillin-binding protein 3)
MLGRTDSRRRLLFILAILLVIGMALVARLAWWQLVQRDDLAARATRQGTVRVEQLSRRGTIYDRSGTVVLATSVDRYRLVAAPDQIGLAERRRAATVLSELLGLDPTAQAALTAGLVADKAYVILARDLDEAAAARIRSAISAQDLAAISLEPEPARVEPLQGGAARTSLAAQLLGFVNRDGVGQYGVEERYQEILAGKPAVLLADRDVNGQPVLDTAAILDPGVPGSDIRLTIDDRVQLAVEQEVLAAAVADQAAGVSAVVLDPRTGEIYAQASYPSYDANQYQAVAAATPERFVDPIVATVYEPGSVFKMFTALAGFEQGTITPQTQIWDSGTLSLDHGQTRIYDADKRAMGRLKAEDIVAYSRNVGAARIALGLAPTTNEAAAILKAVWSRFGFGAKTGIDVAGELAGLVRDPAISRWREIDLANGSFGQGVAVTQIQLAAAFGAMVNGGVLVQPHVVKAIGTQDVPPVPRAQVMDAALSGTMVDLLSHVIHTVPWYRDKTLIRGYVMGGKTGTAQIWDPAANNGQGGWKLNRYNNSFVGFIGRDQPELIIAVRIREPKPLLIQQGNLPLAVESYELFRRIASDAMTMLDLPVPAPTPSSGPSDR